MALYKKSDLNLYDELGVKQTKLNVSQVRTKLTIPDYLEVDNKLTLSSRTDPNYDSLDVGKDLHDLQQKDVSQDTAINAVEVDLDVLDGKVASIEADLLGKTAGIADLNASVLSLQTSDGVQTSRLDAVESVNSTQAGLISQETVDRQADVANLQTQLDSLGITDVQTLAQINQIIADYKSADSSIATEQAQQNARLTTIETTLATLTGI